MTYFCTGSNTTKAANREPRPDPSLPNIEQLNWHYKTGTCQDCGHRFELEEDRNPRATRQVLPYHYKDGTLLEEVVRDALVPDVTAQMAAHHLAQIREETSQ